MHSATKAPTKDATVNVFGGAIVFATATTITLEMSSIAGVFRQPLLTFSLTGIPTTAVVDSATLRIYIESIAGGSPVTLAIGAALATTAWTEVDAAAGPTQGAAIHEAYGAISGADIWIEVPIDPAVVQDWISGAVTNNGLFVTLSPAVTINNRELKFRAREYASTTYDPQLVIEYNSPPAAPASITEPDPGDVFDGSHTTSCTAATDPDGDAVTYEWQLSLDAGGSWPHTLPLVAASGAVDYTAYTATTAARVRVRAVDSLGATSAWTTMASNFTIQHNIAPLSPTLGTPANAASADLAATPTFTWTHRDTAGDGMTAWAMRRKTGGGAYEYWNASTAAWQGTVKKNTWVGDETAGTYTFPAAKWTNGTTYQWSIATYDELGLIGPFASDRTVVGSTAGALTITAPSGSVTDTSTPIVGWSLSDPEGDAQQTYEMRIFTAAQYGAGGFDPWVAVPVVGSGEVTSSTATTWQVTTPLTNGVTYRAYGKVKAGGLYTSVAYSEFTLALLEPPAPSLVAVATADGGIVFLTVTANHAQDERLTDNQKSIEVDTTGWAGSVTTIARSTAQAAEGSASLSLTKITSTGTAIAQTPGSTSGFVVTPGEELTAMAFVKNAATVRDARVRLSFFDAAGAAISTADGAWTTCTTSGWTQCVLTATAPALSAFGRLIVGVGNGLAIVGEVHYADKMSVRAGPITEWGTWADSSVIIERTTDDEDVDGDDAEWTELRGSPFPFSGNGVVNVEDHEAPFNKPLRYRATIVAEV